MKMPKMFFLIFLLVLFISGTIMARDIVDIVKSGKVEEVASLLKKEPDLINQKNENGRALIHIASTEGHLPIVELLVRKGIDVNLREPSHNLTPLHYAARHGRLDVIKFLLANGADLNARENDNETAMYYAVSGKSLDTVKYLEKKGLDVNDTKSNRKVRPIYYAVVFNQEGNTDIIEYLISKGAKTDGTEEGGWNLLHHSAFRANKKMVDALISGGLSPDSKSDTGQTPLHHAASFGNLEAIDTLLGHGANPNMIDNSGKTPLLNAVESGNPQGVALLLKHKADPKLKLKFMGLSPLHIAGIKGYSQIGAMLLKAGADPSSTDEGGNTPLFYACRYSNKTMAKTLLKNGAEKEDILNIFKKKNPITRELEKGEAIVWYTGHSGWAVKTTSNLLVFDYWKRGVTPDDPSLLNGNINPEEIKDLKVSVFISHDHQDHYMPSVFDWKEKVKDITYYTGFDPKDKKGYKFLSPQKTWSLDGMEVTTIEATDSGVAFFIKVDGVIIYHSGDHANMKRDFSGKFKPATDYLVNLGLNPDIYFAPVTGCNFSDKISLKQGVYYTIDKMKPKAVFPMHGGHPEQYIDFVKSAKDDGIIAPFYYPFVEGDWFIYKDGKTKSINKINLVAKDSKKQKKDCDPGCK